MFYIKKYVFSEEFYFSGKAKVIRLHIKGLNGNIEKLQKPLLIRQVYSVYIE